LVFFYFGLVFVDFDLPHARRSSSSTGLPDLSLYVFLPSLHTYAQHGFYDGVVFDYESPHAPGSAEAATYAALIGETRTAFHAVNPSYQISTCVAWSPNDIDGRAYPYVDLAKGSDLLYVMDYDTRSQIFDQCIASDQRIFFLNLAPQNSFSLSSII